MFRHLATSVLVASLACGCSSPSEPDAPGGIRDAPTSVTLEGATLVLQATLWRDYQQISPPDGKPLAAVLRVKTADGSVFPPKVAADMVWVFNGEAGWSPTFEVVATGPASSWLELAMRDGPKWGPGITVDVIVRLRDAAGAPHLLQARAQPIVRTD